MGSGRQTSSTASWFGEAANCRTPFDHLNHFNETAKQKEGKGSGGEDVKLQSKKKLPYHFYPPKN